MAMLHWREISKRLTNTVITSAFLAVQIVVPLGMIGNASATANNPPGNNGTLKVHDVNSPSGTEDNEPKVCAFNFEGFGFDVGQEGYIQIDGQGQTNAHYGDYAFGPTSAVGYAVSQDFNNGNATIADGHYKATLYGKDTGGNIDLTNEKAKSKVFKVECTPPAQAAKPTFTLDKTACTPGSGKTDDDVVVTVTNTDDATDATVTYTVTVGATSKTVIVADGQSGAVTFSGLAANTYPVTVTGDDGTSATASQVTLNKCPKTIQQCEGSTGTTKVTQLNNDGFDFSETRATGHYEYTNGGLHIWTESNTSTDKVAAYKAVDVALTDVGDPSLDYTSNSGIEPGYQLVVDLDNDGNVDGILVGETVYGNNWWLASGNTTAKNGAPHVGGGNGSQWYGTLNEWLANFPDAHVKAFGFSLGSGVKADGVLHNIYFNCHTWQFTHAKEAEIRVKKVLAPSSDNGKFDLNIDGQAEATNVGDNGDTGFVKVSAEYGVKHSVSETAAGNTNMDDYWSSYKCWLTKPQSVSKVNLFTNQFSQKLPSQAPAYSGNGTSVDHIHLKDGEKLTCIFTNKRIPTITIVKDAQPNSSQVFNFETSVKDGHAKSLWQSNNFSLVDNGTNDGQQQKTFKVKGDVSYSFKEHSTAGWKLTDLTCDGGDWEVKNGVLWVSADDGENVTCTFVNVKKSSVTIVKDAQPNSSQVFNFTTNLTGSISEFDLVDDGNNASMASKSFSGLLPGTYTVSEGAMIGWTLTSVTCSNGATYQMVNSKLNITVNAGENITCTFVNKTAGGKGGDVLGAFTSASSPSVTPPAELANTGDENVWLTVIAGVSVLLAAIGLTVASRRTDQNA